MTATWSVHGVAHLYIDGILNATGPEGTHPVGSARPNLVMTVGKFNSGRQQYGQFDVDEWYV